MENNSICSIKLSNVISKTIKLFLIGIFMVFVVTYLLKTKIDLNDTIIIAISASLGYAILDIYTYEPYRSI